MIFKYQNVIIKTNKQTNKQNPSVSHEIVKENRIVYSQFLLELFCL
jgi:hypothetical protein